MQIRWSDNFTIRALAGDELAIAARLEEDELSGWSLQALEDEFGRPGSVLLAAAAGGEVVGWCCARFVGDEAELLKIGVAPGCRRRHCGTELMRELQRRLGGAGVERLYLEVRSRNAAALAFYLRLGFTPAARRIRYYSRPTDDALVLKKIISYNEAGKTDHEKCQRP